MAWLFLCHGVPRSCIRMASRMAKPNPKHNSAPCSADTNTQARSHTLPIEGSHRMPSPSDLLQGWSQEPIASPETPSRGTSSSARVWWAHVGKHIWHSGFALVCAGPAYRRRHYVQIGLTQLKGALQSLLMTSHAVGRGPPWQRQSQPGWPWTTEGARFQTHDPSASMALTQARGGGDGSRDT
jgi:hypothetical protein